jgi:hypothetical protein
MFEILARGETMEFRLKAEMFRRASWSKYLAELLEESAPKAANER